MNKERIREIATLVEKHWAKYTKRNHYEDRVFLTKILQEYKLTDEEWDEVMQECNRRTDKMGRKLWITQYIVYPLGNFLGYGIIIYTCLFFLVSLSYIYSLPSQILFPDGTYPERESLVNGANIIILCIGILLIYTFEKKRH